MGRTVDLSGIKTSVGNKFALARKIEEAGEAMLQNFPTVMLDFY
jgi:hypothetical protein